MKIKSIPFLLILLLLVSSCKKEATLQTYLVENQDKKGFIAVTIPSSILQTQENNVPEDIKETLTSFKKIAVVALPYKNNEFLYEKEKQKLTTILKNSTTYKEIISLKDKQGAVNLYYAGTSEKINEVVALGYGKEKGIGVARILGNNMNPSKILQALKFVNLNSQDKNILQLKTIFTN